MQRIEVPAFVGPSHTLDSINVDADRTINLYLESTAPGNAKAPVWMRRTPGLRPLSQVDDSPGYLIFSQDDRTFVIIGTTFAEVVSNGTATISRGTVVEPNWNLTEPASIVSNGTAGNQLLIVSGLSGYVYDLNANTLTEITNGNFPGTGFPSGTALMCEYMDGYGIVVERFTRKFYFSALNDFTSWDPTDVGERSEASDNIVGVIRNHRELWFLGTATGEVWYNSGDALTPFAPVPGVFLESGAITSSMRRLGNTIAWLSSDERGEGVVYMADGYVPTRISTYPVETNLQSVEMTPTRLFAYQQNGHTFLGLYLSFLETTWFYDLEMGLWHERAMWNVDTAEFEPHLIVDTANGAGHGPWAVSRTNGTIYELNLNVYDDDVVT